MNRNQISIQQQCDNIFNVMVATLGKKNLQTEINSSDIIEVDGNKYHINIKSE